MVSKKHEGASRQIDEGDTIFGFISLDENWRQGRSLQLPINTQRFCALRNIWSHGERRYYIWGWREDGWESVFRLYCIRNGILMRHIRYQWHANGLHGQWHVCIVMNSPAFQFYVISEFKGSAYLKYLLLKTKAEALQRKRRYQYKNHFLSRTAQRFVKWSSLTARMESGFRRIMNNNRSLTLP